jgi:hypothetical protein
MVGDLLQVDRSTGKGYLLHELLKANIAYLCKCYKEDSNAKS